MKAVLILCLLLILYIFCVFKEYFLINTYFALIIKRGIIIPSHFWWNMNDLIMGSHGLTQFYYNVKRSHKNNPLIPIKVMTTSLYMMTDFESIRYMLDNSPGLFGPGTMKISFFEYFMNNNVGISVGQNWDIRRKFNEVILGTNNPIHQNGKFIESITNIINEECKALTTIDRKQIGLSQFNNFSKNVTSRVVFGKADHCIYDMFNNSSDLWSLAFPKIGPVNQRIVKFMQNPSEEYCMMDLLRSYSDKNPEIDMYHQIPHWIFPTNGSLSILLIKLVYFIICHEQSNQNTLDLFSAPFDLVKLTTHTYLEWIILECLRVNNPVVTFFREVLQSNNFTKTDGSIIQFNKGDQLFVLTSPLIRDPEIFQDPSRFNPDRWANRDLQKYSLMFGMGRQICPGADIIKLLLKISLYNLFHNSSSGGITNKLTVSRRTINIDDVDDMINPYNIFIEIN